MADKRHWTKEEEKLLIKNYKQYYITDLAKRFNRSSMSIYKKAVRLGLADKSKKVVKNPWTADEINVLKNNYQKIGLKQTCKLLNRTQGAIQAKSKQLGVQPKQTPTTNRKKRAYKLSRKYGMSLEEYDRMFEKQKGLCGICNKTETRKHQSGAVCRLGVDHRHSDGKIRELLCQSCNLLVGNSKEDIKTLKSAIKYLRKWGD